MLELTGLGSVLRGIGALYWLLAIGLLVTALWKGRTWWRKALGAVVVIAVFGFLPGKALIEQAQRDAYAREAWAYFKKKCETEAGEKVYKTFAGVKSVVVVKPLPPAAEKDLFDQFWYGDPYSNATPWAKRGELSTLSLASKTAPIAYEKQGPGYDFVEVVIAPGHIEKYSYSQGSQEHETSNSDHAASRFGISWEDISKPDDRKYWVAASRLRIVDLSDNSTVAERIGYLIEAGFGSTSGQRRPWLTSRGPNTTCPTIRNGSYEDRWFVLKVLKPVEE